MFPWLTVYMLLTNVNNECLKIIGIHLIFVYLVKQLGNVWATFSTIAWYHCKSSDWEGIYMTPEMKICFAVRKIQFTIVFIDWGMKQNSFSFWSFDLLSLFWWNNSMRRYFISRLWLYNISPEMKKFYFSQNNRKEIITAMSFISPYSI